MGIDNFNVRGDLLVEIKNHETGEIRRYEYKNTATNAFLNRIAQWASGINNTGANSAQFPTKFKMGTGSGTTAKTDSNLFTSVAGSLINVTTRSVSANVTTLIINYPSNYVTGTFTEAGLLDDNLVLLTHVSLSPSIQITANESVSITYTLTFN